MKQIKNSFLLTLLLLAIQTLIAQETEPAYRTKSIFFGGGSYYIDNEQIQELSDFLHQFVPIEEYEFFIQSHTDNIGSMEYNNWLSGMRGSAVHREMVGWGVPSEFISNQDFGELAPDFDNNTWEGRIRNRRVDVIVRRIVF